MMQGSLGTRRLAAAITILLLLAPIHAADGDDRSTLAGVIRGADRTPLADVRLVAVHAETGEVHSSERTGADGNFTLADLPPGGYELAVASGETLYLVETSFYLVPGVTRQVQIALTPDAPPRLPEELPLSWRNNPLVAAFIVFSAAIIVGVLVENATEDEVDTTPGG